MKKSALSNEAARQAQERTSPWKRPRLWRELAVIFLGSLLFAASMNCIVLPTGMYSGGFLGLAQLLRMGLESLVPGLQSLGDLAGAIYFLLNLPLLAIAWSRFGHYFLGKTIACVLFYSVLLAVIPIPEVGVFDEVLTACVIGGLLCGAGAGLTIDSRLFRPRRGNFGPAVRHEKPLVQRGENLHAPQHWGLWDWPVPL